MRSLSTTIRRRHWTPTPWLLSSSLLAIRASSPRNRAGQIQARRGIPILTKSSERPRGSPLSRARGGIENLSMPRWTWTAAPAAPKLQAGRCRRPLRRRRPRRSHHRLRRGSGALLGTASRARALRVRCSRISGETSHCRRARLRVSPSETAASSTSASVRACWRRRASSTPRAKAGTANRRSSVPPQSMRGGLRSSMDDENILVKMARTRVSNFTASPLRPPPKPPASTPGGRTSSYARDRPSGTCPGWAA